MYLTPKEEKTVQVQQVVEKLKHTHTPQTEMNFFFLKMIRTYTI